VKLTEEQRRALADADAHLSLARSALKSAMSPEAARIANVIAHERCRIHRKLRVP
jgi:hypothetical protein